MCSLRPQGIGLSDSESMDGLPERGLYDITVLVGDIHQTRPPLFAVSPKKKKNKTKNMLNHNIYSCSIQTVKTGTTTVTAAKRECVRATAVTVNVRSFH